MLYARSINLCLEERLGELTKEWEEFKTDVRVVDLDKTLHNICTVFDIRNWVLPDGIAVSSHNVSAFLSAQLESIKVLFSHLKEVFLKINSNIFRY